MPSSLIQKTILLLSCLFIALIIYYGTYLPFRKSTLFISAMREARSAELGSLEDFHAKLSKPLDFRSPVGQEELVRQAANITLGIVGSNDDPEIIRQLVDFADKYYEPIIKREKGMSFGQNLYILGALHEAAFIKTRDARYLEKAKFYFETGRKFGPNRPQPLYGLFDVYRIYGDPAAAQEVADKILSQWPGDRRIHEGLAEFFEKAGEFKNR